MANKANRTTRILAAILIAVLFLICGVLGGFFGRPFVWPSAVPAAPSNDQSPTPAFAIALNPVTPTSKVEVAEAPESAQANLTVPQGGVLSEVNGQVPAFSIAGVPETVDPANILRAVGADDFGNVFVNTVDLGTEMLLAEPGVLLVGPDADAKVVQDAGGAIEWISPITQFTLSAPAESANAAEGAFLWFTGANVHAEVRGITIELTGAEGHNWFLMIRGLFPDSLQDSDRNSTVHFTEYVPGHAQVMLYPPGAYISEGNFLQVAKTSHLSDRNCGKEGCSGLTVLMLDLNTGAWVVVHQPQVDTAWSLVDSNWR